MHYNTCKIAKLKYFLIIEPKWMGDSVKCVEKKRKKIEITKFHLE